MISKKQFGIFILALVIIIAFVVLGFRTSTQEVYVPPTSTDQIPNPSQQIDIGTIVEKSQHYTINAVYPKTNSETITNYFKTYVEEQITQFKEDTNWVQDVGSASDGLLSLDITFAAVPSTMVQNYVFTQALYTGGAHGMQLRKTFSFNKEGQLLTLANLFKTGLGDLPTFAKLVQKELLKRENPQTDWIATGAAAQPDNYQAFVVTDTGITVLFDPYQVAPYSDGAIDIAIPTASFKSIAHPDIFLSTQ